MPRYSRFAIDDQLGRRLPWLGGWFAAAFVVTLAGLVALILDVRIAVVGAAVALFVVVRLLTRELRAILVLADARRQAVHAEPKEPAHPLTTSVPVNWWELLNAGFDSIRPQEKYRDEAAFLTGKPWRVLRNGDLRIPVIKLETSRFEAGRFWVYPSHEARLAAYAHLLAVCEHRDVPYGIALFGDSYDGVAVPISDEVRGEVLRLLDFGRKALQSPAADDLPAPDSRLCLDCPWGRPQVVTDGDRRDSEKKIRAVTGNDGRHYHSACGDEFDWTPPHEGAKRKAIVSRDG